MIGKPLRKRTQPVILKLGKVVGSTGISPNVLTVSSLLFALITALFIAYRHYLLAILFLLITGFVDLLDGSVAKVNHKTSNFGNYLDALMDRYSEIIIMAGFAFLGFALEAFFVVTGGLMISYTKARVFHVAKNANNHDWPSFGERIEKIILLTITLLLARFMPFFNGLSSVSILLYVMAIFLYIGTIQRFFYAKKLISE